MKVNLLKTATAFLFMFSVYSITFSQDFIPAKDGYGFQFPYDHHPHYGYKTEWWYYTGHLKTEEGRRFGYQFTIFKIETKPQLKKTFGSPELLYMLHVALTDEQSGQFYFHETFQREFPGLAGFDSTKNRLFVENNSVIIQDKNHQLKLKSEQFELKLDLFSFLGELIHGKNGISQKSPEKGNASHYFSVVDLTGKAQLKIGDQTFSNLSATGWMDHEFGSNALSSFQQGWDWTTLELSNGYRLMLFQVRGENSKTNFYSGSLISPEGKLTTIENNSIQFEVLDYWTSDETKTKYPIKWKIKFGENLFELSPWIKNQELNTKTAGISYYEGAIDVTGFFEGKPVTGVGYLEMTGYGEKMGGKL